MGIFDKVFKSQRDIAKEEIQKVPWHPLTDSSQLEDLKKESNDLPVAIFKHSTTCGISKMVLRKFEREYDIPQEAEVKLYFLDLLANRDLSNTIAEKFGVRHESPQMIILKNEQVVHNSSHQAIEVNNIKEQL